jgi:hypothetical protein
MKTGQDLFNWIHGQATEIAMTVDFSNLEAEVLISRTLSTFQDLYVFKKDVFNVAAWTLEDPSLVADSRIAKACIEIVESAVPVLVSVLTVRHALLLEFDRRSGKNKTSHFFGLLKIGHDYDDRDLQEHAIGHLRGILLAIPRKKGWFHPGEGREGWIGVIDEALAEQLTKVRDLDGVATSTYMADRKFAYVYEQVEHRLTDEVRRLALRPREVAVRDVAKAFGSVPSPPENPDQNLQRFAITRMARTISRRWPEYSASRGILECAGQVLAQPGLIENLNPREIRAMVVKLVAEDRSVSERQASKDVAKFKGLAVSNPEIRRLADEMRGVLPPRLPEKLVLRLGKLTPEQENDLDEEASGAEPLEGWTEAVWCFKEARLDE